MHPGGMRIAMDLFDFEKSANLKHPSGQSLPTLLTRQASPMCFFVQFYNVVTHINHTPKPVPTVPCLMHCDCVSCKAQFNQVQCNQMQFNQEQCGEVEASKVEHNRFQFNQVQRNKEQVSKGSVQSSSM